MQCERDYWREDNSKSKNVLTPKEKKIKKIRSMVYKTYARGNLSFYDKLNVRFLEWQLSRLLGIKW